LNCAGNGGFSATFCQDGGGFGCGGVACSLSGIGQHLGKSNRTARNHIECINLRYQAGPRRINQINPCTKGRMKL
jgi:hypothetical protein